MSKTFRTHWCAKAEQLQFGFSIESHRIGTNPEWTNPEWVDVTRTFLAPYEGTWRAGRDARLVPQLCFAIETPTTKVVLRRQEDRLSESIVRMWVVDYYDFGPPLEAIDEALAELQKLQDSLE